MESICSMASNLDSFIFSVELIFTINFGAKIHTHAHNFIMSIGLLKVVYKRRVRPQIVGYNNFYAAPQKSDSFNNISAVFQGKVAL